ncbi:hypothetical protein [Coraliomargarita parva]|uniref:hypothetical protein n=1 Tax=Coraliomargarita parva TaxID=3014050 RepID=UPI0022B38341|nr:hypothetical protein [Coraliomargarita parva]
MPFRYALSALLLPVVLVCQCFGQSDTRVLNRILMGYTEAYGGNLEARSIESVQAEGVQIQGEQTQSIIVHKKRPSSIRYQLRSGDDLMTAGYNGVSGWLRIATGDTVEVKDLSPEQTRRLKDEATFDSPLFNFLDKPEYTVSLEGTERVGEKLCYVIRVVQEQAPDMLFYLDDTQFYLQKKAILYKDGTSTMETYYRDYRLVDGYPFAFEIENRMGGETVCLIRLEQVEVNVGLLSFFFEKPRG